MLGYAGRIALIAYTLGGMVIPALHNNHHCGTSEHNFASSSNTPLAAEHCVCNSAGNSAEDGQTPKPQANDACSIGSKPSQADAECDVSCVVCGFLSTSQEVAAPSRNFQVVSVAGRIERVHNANLHLIRHHRTDAPRGPPLT